MSIETNDGIALECDLCGARITWDYLRAHPAIQDAWEDAGDEAYCPSCRTHSQKGNLIEAAAPVMHETLQHVAEVLGIWEGEGTISDTEAQSA